MVDVSAVDASIGSPVREALDSLQYLFGQTTEILGYVRRSDCVV